jgi:hypothetical protein
MNGGYMIKTDPKKPEVKLRVDGDLEEIQRRNALVQQDRWHLYMVAMSKKSFGPMTRADKDGLVEYVADVKIIR